MSDTEAMHMCKTITYLKHAIYNLTFGKQTRMLHQVVHETAALTILTHHVAKLVMASTCEETVW